MLYHHRLINNGFMSDDLLMYFTMNDTGDQAVDQIEGTALSKTGNVTNSIPGIKGTCWQNADGGYLGGERASEDPWPDDFTLNLWLNVSATNGDNALIFQLGAIQQRYSDGFGLYMDPYGFITARIRASWNYYTGNAIPKNTWTMVTMVRYPDPIRKVCTFINGKLDTTRTDNASIYSAKKVGMFSRAATMGSASEYITGKLDQIAVWKHAMSQDQIKALYDHYTKPVQIYGIDAENHSKPFSSASQALSYTTIAPPGQLWGYYKGQIFPTNKITATNTNVTSDSQGVFTLGGDQYFTFDQDVLLGDVPRTFIVQATFWGGTCMMFDAGGTDTAGRFACSRIDNYLMCDMWGYTSPSKTGLYTGDHLVAVVYDGTYLSTYIDGNPLFACTAAQNTLSTYRYTIGRSVVQTNKRAYWKSNFCAVYDRALSYKQIQLVTKRFNDMSGGQA